MGRLTEAFDFANTDRTVEQRGRVLGLGLSLHPAPLSPHAPPELAQIRSRRDIRVPLFCRIYNRDPPE